MTNFIFKLIPKILADRIASIAAKIISPTQHGFIKGRRIHHAIGLTSECYNLLHYKSHGGNVGLKIDISKAFDTLDWKFLLQVLTSFGFNVKFINWVTTILNSARLSIIINGSPFGYFSCCRGVRQGDPLSPILFCLAQDALSRGLTDLYSKGTLLPITSPRGIAAPTHIFYADDIMLFCKGTKKCILAVLSLFEAYGNASGQFMCNHKSKVLIGKNATSRLTNFINTLGMQTITGPFSYLGVPIFRGVPTKLHLQATVDKIRSKLEGWQSKLLSFAGRIELIKTVIHPMLLHSFMLYQWPKSLINKLNCCVRNFVWSGDPTHQKSVTVAWNTVCSTTSSGGVGIRSFLNLNKAALLKSLWEVLSSSSQWADFLKCRFDIQGTQSKASYRISSIWKGFKTVFTTIPHNTQWLVQNGHAVDFFLDNWLGSPIIIDHAHLNGINNGVRVSNFIVNGHWHLPPDFHLLYPVLHSKITSIHLPPHPQPDILVWQSSIDGSLSFKNAYNHFSPPSKLQWTNNLWSSFILPRFSTLLWRVLHNKLPTQTALQVRGHQLASRCEICGSNIESANHLFIQCPFANLLWNWLFDTFALHFRQFHDAMSLWLYANKCDMSSQTFHLWIFGIQCCFYIIWKARNQSIFHNVRPIISKWLHYLKSRIHDISSVAPGNMHNSVADLAILKSLGVPGHPCKAPKVLEVYWLPPPPGWIKLNTDGLSNSTTAATGGVFRNSRGLVLGCFCMSIGQHTAFYAEMLALIQGLTMAKKKGWTKLWIELDSSSVIQCLLNSSYKPPWTLHSQWLTCKDFLSSSQFYASHIYREGNQVADKLSNMGTSFPSFQWWHTQPQDIASLSSHDAALLPNYRFT